jgi:hypothetical protein
MRRGAGAREREPDGARVGWAQVRESVRPDHGYSEASPQVQWLVEFMASMGRQERRPSPPPAPLVLSGHAASLPPY